MSLYVFGRCRPVLRMMAIGLAIGFIGLGCRQVAPKEASKPAPVPGPPETKSSPETKATNDNSGLLILWQEQMNQASGAMARKNFAQAGLFCAEALKTARQIGPADARLTTNLVLQAEIYQMQGKTNLAEQTFIAALTNREQVVGPDHPDLVMPLDGLTKFYYFVEHRYDLATPLCLRILKIVEQTSPGNDAEVENRARAVAVVYRQQGEYALAEPFYQQSVDRAAKIGGDELANGLLATAGFYHDWGKYDQAEALCQRALAMQEKVAQSNTNNEAQMNLAVALYGLAENYRAWGKLDQAEPLYGRSVEIVEKTLGPDSPDLARPLAGQAATLLARGKTNQAAILYQHAFAVTENKMQPGDPVARGILDQYTAVLDSLNRTDEANTLRQAYQWEMLMFNSQRARKAGSLDDAERLAGQALDVAASFGRGDPRLAKSQVQIAEVYRQQGKTDLAEQTYKNAIASYESAVGPNDPGLILPLESLANFYNSTKIEYDQVAALYQQILNIVRAAPAANPMEVARWERNLADVYHQENQNAQAEASFQQALATIETATNLPAGEQVQYLQALSDFYKDGRQFDQAERLAKRALAIREQADGLETNPDAQLDVAVCCDALAQIYLAANKPAEAESFYDRSLPLVEKISGADSSDLTPRLMGLATALRAQNKYAEAEVQYKRALLITQKANGPDGLPVADLLDQYATLLTDLKKPDDAKGMRDWADSIRKQNAALTN